MDVFDLFAKIKLDSSGYEKGLNAAKELGSKVASGITTAFKASAAAVGAASTALTALVKSSLSQYANYEQLVGGVEKIFGDSAKKVQEYANEAYKTAGLSANEYMETVTSFSASLMQGLKGDTEATADVADRAIRDMADNANTYGTDMQSIQNAYMGFSKQNYTMLDNLKLGYGGTKEEMERLIKDASQMTTEMKELGVSVDVDSMSFDNIINAISVMQKHLKISGTTAKEAGATITGSVGSMKAAWKNFLTGTGSPQQFVDSLVGSIGNISRQLKNIVPRLVEGLKGLAAALAPELPKMLMDILPTIIDGAVSLLTTVAEMLPDMIDTLLPPLIQGIVLIMSAIIQNLPQILQSFADALPVVLTTLMENSGGMVEAGKEMLSMLKDGLVAGVKYISDHSSEIIVGIFDAIENLSVIASNAFEFAGDILSELVDGLLSEKTLNTIVQKAPDVIKAIVNALVTGIGEAVELGAQIIGKLVYYLFGDDAEEHWTDLIQAAGKIIQYLWDGIVALGENLGGYFVGLAEKIADAMGLGEYWKYGAKMISDLWDGVKQEWERIKHKFEAVGEWIYDSLHATTAGAAARMELNNYLIEQGVSPEQLENEYEQSEIDRIRKENHFGEYATQEDRIERGNNTYYGLPEYEATPENYAARFHVKGVPVFGKGGIVTKPTLALIGEDGAEAVVPLEKDSEVGRRFGGSNFTIEKIEVNVDAHGMDDIDNLGNIIVAQIDTALRRYQVQQTRGQGGTAW